jgi:hypothetical protein
MKTTRQASVWPMRAASLPPQADAPVEDLRAYARAFNAIEWVRQTERGDPEVLLAELSLRPAAELDLEELRAVLFHVQRDRRWVGDGAAAFEQRQRMVALVEEIRRRLLARR